MGVRDGPVIKTWARFADAPKNQRCYMRTQKVKNRPLIKGEFTFNNGSGKEAAELRTNAALLASFSKLIPAVFYGQTGSEVFLRPAQLRDLSRQLGAFAWILAPLQPQPLATATATRRGKSSCSQPQPQPNTTATLVRAERVAFSRAIDKSIGRRFSNGVRFDSIGWAHSKIYRFTKS